MIAHNGSEFDSYIVLKNLPQRRSIFKLFKNGAGFISFKKFNGYVDENKKFPNEFILDVGEFILNIL